MTIAITGATGFVGGRLLLYLQEQHRDIRALARRPMKSREGVTWVQGDLADHPALDQLVVGCESVIHVAGVLNTPDAAGFEAGNVLAGNAQIHRALLQVLTPAAA